METPMLKYFNMVLENRGTKSERERYTIMDILE